MNIRTFLVTSAVLAVGFLVYTRFTGPIVTKLLAKILPPATTVNTGMAGDAADLMNQGGMTA